jgi:hypothetical protein
VFRYTSSGKAIQFEFSGALWTCQLKQAACASGPLPHHDEVPSPDGKWIAYGKDYNLWVRPAGASSGFALTSDGTEHFAYAAAPGESLDSVSELRRHEPDPPIVLWSPDSRYLLTHRIDERQVKELHLLQSVPEDGSLRPKVYSYRFSMPGDAQIPQLEPFVFGVTTHGQVRLSAPPVTGAFISLISNRCTWWSQDSRKIYYLDRDRFSKWVTLNIADPISGKARELIRETSDTWVRMGDGGVQNNPAVRTLSNGDVLWYSERDGYGHFYYYDGRTGALRNQITRGDWVARAIVHVDEAGRRLYFMASGREPGRDPYERRLYRVNFDGNGLALLTPEEAEHDVHFHEGFMDGPIDPLSTEAEEEGFSGSGRYFIDTNSRPDTPSTLVLRKADGKLVRQLEVADISALRAGGYTPVEPFSALAADGKTQLFGNILRPSSLPVSRAASGSRRSRLIGRYDSQLAFGQRRVLLVWLRIASGTISSAISWVPSRPRITRSGLRQTTPAPSRRNR